jgi:hypothetical protein
VEDLCKVELKGIKFLIMMEDYLIGFGGAELYIGGGHGLIPTEGIIGWWVFICFWGVDWGVEFGDGGDGAGGKVFVGFNAFLRILA